MNADFEAGEFWGKLWEPDCSPQMLSPVENSMHDRLRYRWEHTWPHGGADFSIVLDGHYVARIRKTLRHMPVREVWSWGTFPFSINGHGFGPSGLEETKMDAARAAEAAIDELIAAARSNGKPDA